MTNAALNANTADKDSRPDVEDGFDFTTGHAPDKLTPAVLASFPFRGKYSEAFDWDKETKTTALFELLEIKRAADRVKAELLEAYNTNPTEAALVALRRQNAYLLALNSRLHDGGVVYCYPIGEKPWYV